MSHGHNNSATNGASLEDCHANFFSLTDVCGIKWVVYREPDDNPHVVPNSCSEDPILASYARCLQSELLSVWRRVPKRDLVTYTLDMSGNRIPTNKNNSEDDKGPSLVLQKKELWIFWYGDRPVDQFRKLLSSKLKEVQDISGTWENGLPYEARTLLFKALNNLIERNLVLKDFVRIGKWYVQPFDGPDRFSIHPNSPHSGAMTKNTHLSFAFHYFIHGESSVCASVDVRQHPPVRKLSLHHLSLAKSQTAPVPVILAPYGLAGTLTGVTFKREERNVEKLLKEWDHFYPLAKNKYCCQNTHGEMVAMPPAVEVLVAGVRLIYPTCYLLVSDMDLNGESTTTSYGTMMESVNGAGVGAAAPKAMQTCHSSGDPSRKEGPAIFQVEPSPFTASMHPLLIQDFEETNCPNNMSTSNQQNRAEHVWQDSVFVNPEGGHLQQHEEHHQSQIVEYIGNQWDFANPGRLVKKKPRKQNSREKSSKDNHRARISSKISFHKKPDIVDELAWSLDHADLFGSHHGTGLHHTVVGGLNGRLRGATPSGSNSTGNPNANPASMGPPGSVRGGNETGVNSPASLGTPINVLTPKAPNPGSVRTPGDPTSSFLMSPHPPMSPLTPAPRTPKSVPPPSSYSAASPYMSLKSVEPPSSRLKTEPQQPPSVKQEDQQLHSGPPSVATANDAQMESQQEQQQQQQPQQLQQPQQQIHLTSQNVFLIKQEEKSDIFFKISKMKRPALPLKEYEMELEKQDSLSDNIYDYQPLHHWLNHPVKKFRPHEDRSLEPKRPMYRRQSQANVFDSEGKATSDSQQFSSSNSSSQPMVNGNTNDHHEDEVNVKTEPNQEGEQQQQQHQQQGQQMQRNGTDPYDFENDKDDKQRLNEDGDLFSTEGLKPTMADLDNLFDDDDSNGANEGGISAPTPPDSNKPAESNHDDIDDKSKLSSVIASVTSKKFNAADPAGNLPHDQLAHMFPTPPSHEHNHTSPAECTMEIDHYGTSVVVKGELGLHSLVGQDLMEWTPYEDISSTVMFSSTKFTPIKLYSDDLSNLSLPEHCCYKPRQRNRMPMRSAPNTSTNPNQASSMNNNGKVPTPLGSGNNKAGMSPISPLTSGDGPRSVHGPGSVGQYRDLASPASVSSTSNYLNKSSSSAGANNASSNAAEAKAPEANSLLLNLVLSDTLLNIFRDHNFDSCTLCVCNNEGNVKGRDAAVYLPQDFAGDDDISCSCGYSAVVNRRLAHQSGLFYEDETEVTSITEDLYYRKKTSILLLDHKTSTDNDFNEKSAEVDSIPPELLRLIHRQSSFSLSEQHSLVKYAKMYLRNSSMQNHQNMSMVELMDNNDVIFMALDQIKNMMLSSESATATSTTAKLDEALKGSCIHKWTLLPAPGPYCSEDIIRVMKCLQPVLNRSLHNKKDSSTLSVQGPLTWRQFHRMAGPATKGNTDDQCEPLPVPSVTVGNEKDFLSISPLALEFWESMSLEPFSRPRDVVYMVLAPDNDFLLGNVKTYFENLSSIYELCKLGRHVSYPKLPYLKVGKNMANRLANGDTERWFDLIGDFPTAALLKLYSQVCRHYLLPLLLRMNVDRSAFEPLSFKAPLQDKPPPSPMHGSGGSGSNLMDTSNNSNAHSNLNSNNTSNNIILADKNSEDGSNKENNLLGGMESPADDNDIEPPAVVIYMVDPFSFGADNCDMMRLSNLALLRCFSQMTPSLTEPLKNNIFLQVVSLESILELTQTPPAARMPSMMRGMAFSVFSQVQRPMQYVKDCKTLTGFGPASAVERYLKTNEAKAQFVRDLYQPAFVLAPPPNRRKSSDAESGFGSSSNERSSVLFVNYCLSEDQHWLLATCCDDRGEIVKTVIINIDIPNKTRRKKASARRVGLKRLMDWILSVLGMSLVAWRLVIGRIGRIGHGELRGWSVLLGGKALKKATKQLRETCAWSSDVPSILSACLVSMEPDSHLRLMSDQFTPDERFGQTASNCQLSTPKDATCSHILVFPTSATAQSSQKAFEDHQDGIGAGANDLDDFGLPMDIGDLDGGDNDGLGDIGDLKDIFSSDAWGAAGMDNPGSPGSPSGKRNSMSEPNSPSQTNNKNGDSSSSSFRYGQEEPGERLEFLQQPLALGYLVSTARTGFMPKWFWASCPHLENVCPVFLKSALHLNQANLLQCGDDGFAPNAASGRVHSLDSTYTTDVLRYVLEGYNALSWLSLDPVSKDRKSCLPLHVQILQQMYTNFAALV